MAEVALSASDIPYTQLPDMFPGLDRRIVTIDGLDLFMRTGGEGPPLLLLHGYPQNHVCWHRIAPELARHFSLIIPDLPGYGYSAMPPESRDHEGYSKREMAALFVKLMAAFGHQRFNVVGHDRGGACRLSHGTRSSRLRRTAFLP
ncbi:alpha/beta fold hydrolase [uncultured Cohaesibacter sp.]|uniref:alpha/beta fold hydrolase n=1 Tax=uncultured Cohaesibacter sp. TaxID=1002546 RepID=UPI0029C7A2DE|nr:alpha/beta fold hydrolase [uncultured Cohaesibacter sp.]